MIHLTTIIEDSITGEQICACCGMVISEKTTVSKNPLNFQDKPKKEHHHTLTESHHDYGMGSIADPSQKKSWKINKWQKRLRVSNSKDRKIAQNFEVLGRIFSKHSIPKNIQNITFHLSRKATDKKIDGGKGADFQLALLYFAYGISGNKINRNEFEKTFQITKENIFKKSVWIIQTEFNIVTDHKISIVKSIYRHGVDLKFSKKAIDLAITIYHYAEKKNLTSSRPLSGIAATALYIAAYSTMKNSRGIQEIIADKCNVSKTTITTTKSSWKDVINLLKLKHVAIQYSKKLRIKDL